MIADSSGSVRVMVGNCSEGLPALGSWCGIKRIEGRCLFAAVGSEALSWPSTAGGVGVLVGVGPVLLRTESCGVAVSARVRVISEDCVGGEAGGESVVGWASEVVRLVSRAGRAASGRFCEDDDAGNPGEAGGV